MKIPLLALALYSLFCLTPLRADGPVGRYTLMAGTFKTMTGEEEKVILKLDTVTGETWVYRSLSMDVSPKASIGVEGWNKATENVEVEWAEMQKKFPNGKPSPPTPAKR